MERAFHTLSPLLPTQKHFFLRTYTYNNNNNNYYYSSSSSSFNMGEFGGRLMEESGPQTPPPPLLPMYVAVLYDVLVHLKMQFLCAIYIT